MSQLGDAVKAAASVVFGTGPWQAGQQAGSQAGDPFSAVFDAGVARSIVDGMDAGDLYATQPHLRTVVSFVARNVAQLGRHVYTKSADGRTRVEASAATQLLAKPNDYMTGYDLFNMLFSELALYDMAIWVPVLRDGRWQIDPIPGEWVVGIKKENAFRQAGYRIKYPTKNEDEFLPAANVIVFRGYSPHGFQRGSSPVRSLRATLGEQVAAINFREQMWRRGGRIGMYMTRPKDAPVWSKEAKTKFVQNWRANWSGNGASAGSTPLLEDGMELKRVGFNAKEEQWLEAATLSLATVAGAYHVPPSMVGGQGGSDSFASVKEFRKMLYTETMGPSIAQVEETINTFLFPFIGEPSSHYLELNIQEKLQGDFEEQSAAMKDAVGGPWMTANEARSRFNLSDVEGGDVLLAPLNMGATGNNGPAAGEPIGTEPSGASDPAGPDEAPPKANGAHTAKRGLDGQHICVKAPVEPDYGYVSDMSLAIKRVVRAQRKEVAGKLTAGKANPTWWDQKKWNQELSALLQPAMTSLSAGVATEAAGAKGLDPEAYSVARTTNFLKAVADSRADLINASLRDRLLKELEEYGDSPDFPQRIEAIFQEAIDTKAAEQALTMGTMLSGWAMTEMARQLLYDQSPKKTWVSSGLPDSRHAAMNGETVPIDEPFSNGAQWPGDPVLGAKGVSNCGCGVDITY